MTFAEADAQYEVVKQQYLAGALDDNQFDEQLHRLMVLDDAGLWWAKSRENGSWHVYDSSKGGWVAAAPPAGAPPAPPLPSFPSKPAIDPLPKQAETARTPSSGASPAQTGAGESTLPKWAAVQPSSAAATSPVPAARSSIAPAGGASAGTSAGGSALPGTSQGAPATAGYDTRDFGPMAELTGGMKVLFYALSLLLPLLGLILFFVYRNKPAQADRSAARAFLILGVAAIVFSCMCSTTFFLLESMLGTGT